MSFLRAVVDDFKLSWAVATPTARKLVVWFFGLLVLWTVFSVAVMVIP